MDDSKKFFAESRKNIKLMNKDDNLKKLSWKWFVKTFKYKYPYNFTWLGLPVIQYPHDLVLLQEIIWNLKPRIIVETGVARGGSLIFYASMINLLNNKGKVIGIDIDIRKHNRDLIEKHFLSDKIEMIESSSVKQDTFNKVKSLSKDYRNILVMLDSNHTESHVLKELNLYSSLISKNSYCIVFDTIVEKMDSEFSKNRPWNKKNSPQSAIQKFLKKNDEFIVDKTIDKKIILSMAPGGFLKKIK